MSYQPLRIHPRADLRRALEDAVRNEQGQTAFVVSGIGSLANAKLRLAGAESETSLTGSFEILCLSGTLSLDGAHLHIAIADTEGRVTGGHLCYGNEIRTTAEVLLARLSDWTLSRELDPETGYQELVVSPERPGKTGDA